MPTNKNKKEREPMLKLCSTLILGAFLIYGLDDLGVISSDSFKVIEKPVTQENEDVSDKQAKSKSRFTDRIVQKRKNQKEGV